MELTDVRHSIPWTTVLSVLGAVLILSKLISIVLQYRRLSHINGPLIASLTPFWLFYHTCKGDVYLACQAGLRKYGSPLRVAPNIVVTDDPLSSRMMTAPKSPFIRGHWFKGMKLDPRVDNILSVTDENRHAEMRNRVTPGYSGSEVPGLENDVDGRIVELMDLIHREYIGNGKALDFALISGYFTLDILTTIAFGAPLGFLTKNEDVFDYIKTSAQFFPIMELGSNHPTIFNILNSPLMASAQPKPTDKFGLGAILGHTNQVIDERFAAGAKPKNDMLGSFIKHGLSKLECQSESMLQLLAGADSTATALRTTVLHILTSPYVYGKLVKEIHETVSTGKASSPVIKNSEAQALPYLRAVIMEGLRMFMPLNGLAGRLPPKGGFTLNEVFIPEGTETGFAVYSMLRREDLFGHDADTFRPERWIDNDPAFIQSMEKNHELVFGSGRSSCLGKNIALMELRKTIFELLRACDLTLVDAFKPIYSRSNSVVVQKNMFVRAYPRQA